MTEKTVMKRSSVAVRTAIISRPVVMKTETTTSVPSFVLTEKGHTPRRGRGSAPYPAVPPALGPRPALRRPGRVRGAFRAARLSRSARPPCAPPGG